MSDSETIVCKPTKWFLWRAIAMLAMFLFLGGWFVKDGMVGYPKKNVVFYTYKAFEAAEKEFEAREKAGQSSAGWERFAAEQRIPFPEEKGVLPKDVDSEQAWPEVLLDYEGYRKAYEAERSKVEPPLWSAFSDSKGWGEKPPKTDHDAKSIRNQFVYGAICGLLAVGALFILLRCLSREMKVDGEGYYPPGGGRIPFGSMHRIDKRKWDTKGLATLSYRTESGEEKSAKVDGMVYGQFHPENGAPAQALFDRIMSNFSGELVELQEEDSSEKEEVSGEEQGD